MTRAAVLLMAGLVLMVSNTGLADPLAYEDSSFGVFAAYAQEYAYFKQQMGFDDQEYWDWADSHIRELGAHWTRSNLQLFWDLVEPVLGGGYNWDNEFKTNGVITNIYRSDGQINWLGVFHEGGNAAGHGSARNPLDYPTEYAAFVQAAVEHYDGDGIGDSSPYVKVKWWQVGNEAAGWTNSGRTVSQYCQWVRMTRQAALAADPNAKIVLIAGTNGGALESFVQQAIQNLSADRSFEAIDLHHWGAAVTWKMPAVSQARTLLNSLGLQSVQIWSMEHGTHVYQPTGWPNQTEQDQARSLVKRYVYNRDLGLDKLCWNNLVEWNNFGGNPGSTFNCMGLIGDGALCGEPSDGLNNKRVSYYTYKLLAAKTDTHYASKLGKVTGVHQDGSLYAYAYQRKGVTGRVHVLWSETGTQTVNLPTPAAKIHVTNLITDSSGNILQQFDVTPSGGYATFQVGADPLLVEDYDTEGTYLLEMREFWITAPSGARLYGRVIQPSTSAYPGQTFPAVVFVPGGLGSGATTYDKIAPYGFVEVHFNAEGRGGSPADNYPSEGTEDYNGRRHQDDLNAVIEYTLDLTNVRADNVGVCTSSYGITMGAGCLGRHTSLPVKYLVDNEGPDESYVTCFEPWSLDSDPANDKIQQGYNVFGHYSTYRDPSPANRAWWQEREGLRSIRNIRCRYMRLQAAWDHAQPPNAQYPTFDYLPDWYACKHGVDMVNAAIDGTAPWVRMNPSSVGNGVNEKFGPDHRPLTYTGSLQTNPTAKRDAILEMAAMPSLQRGLSCGQARDLASGEGVTLDPVIVMLPLYGYFYAQDPDRAGGIRIESSEPVDMGDVVSIRGPMGSIGCEGTVTATSLEFISTGKSVPQPLGVTVRDLAREGGPDGQLVTTWGWVTQKDTDHFYVYDASLTSVRVQFAPSALSDGDLVFVTGISSCADNGRMVIPRSGADIVEME